MFSLFYTQSHASVPHFKNLGQSALKILKIMAHFNMATTFLGQDRLYRGL